MYKKERFGFLLTKEEKTALSRLAEIEGGLSLAALLRKLIRTEAQKYGIWPYPPSMKGGLYITK
ncbi:hypothetical protein ACFLV7_04250 [Chloroflexota bacterium]